MAEDLLPVPETGDPRQVGQGYSLDHGTAGNAARLEAVDLCGVEEGNSQLQRAADDGTRFMSRVPVAVAPVGGAELVGAQPDLRDVLAGSDL